MLNFQRVKAFFQGRKVGFTIRQSDSYDNVIDDAKVVGGVSFQAFVVSCMCRCDDDGTAYLAESNWNAIEKRWNDHQASQVPIA